MFNISRWKTINLYEQRYNNVQDALKYTINCGSKTLATKKVTRPLTTLEIKNCGGAKRLSQFFCFNFKKCPAPSFVYKSFATAINCVF